MLEDDFSNSVRAMYYAQAVHDVYAQNGLICAAKLKSVGDLMTLVVRHFTNVMDENDFIPSQTCGEDVIYRILLKRFPCESASNAETPAE